MEDVAVVGWAQSDYRDALVEETRHSLVYRVITKALDSAGLTIQDIDIVFSTGSDIMDGGRISVCDMVGALGGHFREEFRVAGDGLKAAMLASMRISSGFYNTAIVVGYSKNSESKSTNPGRKMADPYFHRPLGIDELVVGALQERSYLHHFNLNPDDVARVAVRNRVNGVRNRHVESREPVSLEEALSSHEVMPPIREIEMAPVSDGACAVILSEEKTAKSMGKKLAWITGSGTVTQSFQPGSQDINKIPSARKSTMLTYEKAGIEDPLTDLNVIEMGYQYAYQELMLYEAAGLCGHGEGPALLDELEKGEKAITINPSGGSLCANPRFAAGLVRLAEAASQVTEQAGRRQVKGARRAMAMMGTGLAMQSAGCILVER